MGRAPTRRSCGQRAQRVCRLFVTLAGQSGEARRDHHRLLDRCALVLLEVAKEPACGDAWMPVPLLAGDQDGQLKRLGEADPPTSLAVASATSKFPCSSARRKTVRGCPCEVIAAPPGADRRWESSCPDAPFKDGRAGGSPRETIRHTGHGRKGGR
jgi:hypothetical protein